MYVYGWLMQHVEMVVPTPSKDEILVKVEATALNPIDWKIQNGILRPLYPRKFPCVPGNLLKSDLDFVW